MSFIVKAYKILKGGNVFTCYQMDSRNLQEISSVVSHEEHIHYNKASLFNLATKIHEIEMKHLIVAQAAEIKGALVALKQQLVVVVECSVLHNMIFSIFIEETM